MSGGGSLSLMVMGALLAGSESESESDSKRFGVAKRLWKYMLSVVEERSLRRS